jgi:hypothetical protein
MLVNRGSVVWRSVGIYDPQSLGSAVFGTGWLAFSLYRSDGSDLYTSTVPGSEHKVAESEDPVGVSPTGNLILSRWKSNGENPDLILRRPDGMPLSMIASRVLGSWVEPESGTILYQQQSVVRRTNGIRSWTIARLGSLGVPGLEWVERLQDGRILVTGRRSVAMLNRYGRMIAHATLAPIPPHGSGWISISGTYGQTGLVVNSDPSTGALVLVQAFWRDANAGGGPGWEGVYELPRGGSAARLLFGKRITLAVCAHGSSVSRHGRWLLYSTCEGRVVAIDTTGRQAAIDLSRVSRSVPMPKEERGYGASAEWASFGAEADMARSDRLT